jgi:hypothetical protein
MGGAAAGLVAVLAALTGGSVDQTFDFHPDGGRVAPLAWDQCGAELPDWREPRLRVVLSDGQDARGHGALPGLAGTAFALYNDGTVYVRQQRPGQLLVRRSRLSPAEANRLTDTLDVVRLLALPGSFVVAGPERPTFVKDGCREDLVLHLWVDGCHRTLAVTNLSVFAVAGRPDHDSRRALGSLPPVLASALRALVTFQPRRSEVVCRNASCFDPGRAAPNQVAWLPESARENLR